MSRKKKGNAILIIMDSFPVWLLVFFFVAEGLGIGRDFLPFFYYTVPLLFFYPFVFKNAGFLLPKKLTVFFLVFVLFSFVSSFFSFDKEKSLIQLAFFVSSYLIFLFFHNRVDLGKKYIRKTVFFGSVIFLFFFLLSFFIPEAKNIQKDGYQLTRSIFGYHNHLGDFLGLVLIFLLHQQSGGLLMFIVFLPFFLLSYSKSSYLALLAVFVFIFFKSVRKTLFLWLTMLMVIVFALSLSYGFQKNHAVGSILRFFHQKDEVFIKSPLSERDTYLKQIMTGFFEKPIFGYGPGNFAVVSYRNRIAPEDFTETSHNIFLEILIETGIIGLAGYLAFLIAAFVDFKKKSVYFFLFLYLLFNFQTNYIYRIYSVYVFFVSLIAVGYREKDNLIGPETAKTAYFAVSVFLFFLVNQIMISKIAFLKGNMFFSRLANPLNGQALLQTDTNAYLKLFQSDDAAIREEAAWQKNKNSSVALTLYEKAYFLNPFGNPDLISTIYSLTKKLKGTDAARDFASKELVRYKNLASWQINEKQQAGIINFCDREDVFLCDKYGFSRFKYFVEPKPKERKKVLDQVMHPEEYLINNDTLNERFDYSVKKPKNTFRTVVLGDSLTWGLLVKTKDNWTEKLEDMLNKNRKSMKYEIINLAVHGYDIPYQVERYRKRGIKYDPDLILWFIGGGAYHQYNELLNEKSRLIEEGMTKEDLKNEYEKGNYYTVWEKAYQETLDELTDKGIEEIASRYLIEMRKYYKGKIIIVGYPFSDNKKEFFTKSLGDNNDFVDIEGLENRKYQFPEYKQINESGHTMIAERVLKYFQEKYKQ